MWAIAEVDIKELGGVITSSPLPTPRETSAQTRASVPLLRATQCLTFNNLYGTFKNFYKLPFT